jgi:hypothetical protein
VHVFGRMGGGVDFAEISEECRAAQQVGRRLVLSSPTNLLVVLCTLHVMALDCGHKHENQNGG